MRPERLTLKGFGVFRQETRLDFSDVELFALTGPTGSGKTTVLDGICFALYGSVPRHGKGAVAPVVSQGLMEANVGLTFSIGDDLYQVARRIKKDAKGKGAKISEASLERIINNSSGESVIEVLATGGQVTDRVMELLGLDFDQFTTCVLLPQGEFARFLHDKPANRQDLLTALLDLGIYDRLSQLALIRQRAAEGVLGMIDQRLVELGGITDQDLVEARYREATLDELLRWVEEILPELTAIEREALEHRAEADRLEAMLVALRSLEIPEDLDVLSKDLSMLRSEEDEARGVLEDARSRANELIEVSSNLPSSKQVDRWLEARRELVLASEAFEPATLEVSTRLATLDRATAAVVTAREEARAVADADRAAHLRRELKAGDPCPVCGQVVNELPASAMIDRASEADEAVALAETTEAETRMAHAGALSQLNRLEDRIAGLGRELEDVPELDQLTALAKRVEEHEQARATSQAQVAEATRRFELVAERRKALAGKESAIRTSLQRAWAKVAQIGLEPPVFDVEDPIQSWQELSVWRTVTEPRIREAAEKASAMSEEVGQRRKLVADSIDARLQMLEVAVDSASPRDAVVEALAAARNRRHQIESALTEVVARTAEREKAAHEQQVARELSLELRADRFKQWLFDEVFTALVAGANVRLGDLTRGQYEMVLEGRDFEVIDNLSAGSRRSIKTLSGGETFLVSLALALALADQVAETAMGEARLDSFFLDEGFGTLDTETLEVVAGVITDLGASGKTVGIVSHVAELAEQMPVRYEIRKSADGARIEEVRND